MRFLIGCEVSGRVRDALRARGHDAWSCDLKPNNTGPHYQCDLREVLDLGWDALIAFPDCTYVCSSGLHWNHRVPGRAQKTDEAVEFFRFLLNYQAIPKRGLENPIGCLSTRVRKPDQIIQPWWFGDDASKSTCLWLEGLPKLVRDPNKAFPPRYVCMDCKSVSRGTCGECSSCGSLRVKERWGNQTDSGQNKLGPSDDRAEVRSMTYQGIANQMAEQWG